MSRAIVWMTLGTAVVAGIALASCKGKSEQAATVPVASAPSPETVVHKAKFSSPAAKAWLASKDSMIEVHHAGANLGWSNTVGKKRRIVEAGCTDELNQPTHCHLEVSENSPGKYEPERYFTVTNGSRAKTYNIEINTIGNTSERMTCTDVEEVSGNDQAVTGTCDIYPAQDALGTKHSFCAHTEEGEQGAGLEIWYRFTHEPCTESSGEIHNGTGHTE
jgi:hypothetical protein